MNEDKILQAIANMQASMMNMQTAIESRFDKVESRLDKLESRLDKLESRLDKLESDVSTLTQSQLQLTAEVEDRVEKLIQGLYDGYKINAERFDKINFDSIKYNSEIALLLAKDNSVEIQKLKKIIEKIA